MAGFRVSIRNQQPGRHAVSRLGGERDLLACEAGFLLSRDHLHVEGHPALTAGQRACDFLEMSEDMVAADVPVSQRLDRLLASLVFGLRTLAL